MPLHLIIGPPGTGKTTTGAKWVARAVDRWGPENCLVCSLTRAASREAAGRDTGLSPKMIGTWHSFASRAIGSPAVVTTEHAKEWNQRHPSMQIGASEVIEAKDVEINIDPTREDLLRSANLLRAQRIKPSKWPKRVKDFYWLWLSFKKEKGIVDFPEMIERALDEAPIAPGSPSILFADEHQDASPLEDALFRSWALAAGTGVAMGDSLQAIYGWRGGDPSSLLRDDYDERRVLDQSYRVPAAVHARATRITRGLPGSDAIYRPTQADGAVDLRPYRYDNADEMMGEVRSLLEGGESVMLLVSCEYMSRPIVQALRGAGIPYHNPYAAGRWSPLVSKEGQVSTWERIAAFLRPLGDETAFAPRWTAEEVSLWVEMLRSDVMAGARGRKTRLTELDPDTPLDVVERLVLETFGQGQISGASPLDALFEGDLEWFIRHSVGRFQKSAVYPMEVLSRVGRERFLADMRTPEKERPWVIVGTIHSVKGGEADHVYLFPDLSSAGMNQITMLGQNGRNAIRRLFYVAMTRAKKRLVICQPSGPHRVVL